MSDFLWRIFSRFLAVVLFPVLYVIYVQWRAHERRVLGSVRCDGGEEWRQWEWN